MSLEEFKRINILFIKKKQRRAVVVIQSKYRSFRARKYLKKCLRMIPLIQVNLLLFLRFTLFLFLLILARSLVLSFHSSL